MGSWRYAPYQSLTDLITPSMNTLGVSGFPHMDMILLAGLKVDPKEREPRRANPFLPSNSWIRLVVPSLMRRETRAEMRQKVLPWIRFLHLETWGQDPKVVCENLSVKYKLSEERRHIFSLLCLPTEHLHGAGTDMALRSCLPMDQWPLLGLCDFSSTGSVQKEQKLLWFDPSHCQSLPNPTIWECESQADDPIVPWGNTSALLLPKSLLAKHLTLIRLLPPGATECVWIP